MKEISIEEYAITLVRGAAKKIAYQLSLGDCMVVDLGTEAIYESVSGEDFWVTHRLGTEMQK